MSCITFFFASCQSLDTLFSVFTKFLFYRFDENMIETLFGYGATEKSRSEQKKESSSQDPSPQFIQIIDPKKAQNLAILLRALNVTIEEVCDALCEGNFLSPLFLASSCIRN